jgi:uncharacterized phage protein (TIGR01671 family)
MNRVIKFRAWNEVSEKMLNWNEFLNTNMKNTFIAPESTGLILMQYTGLHDKNGKEIYEGDIVYCQTKYGKAKAIIKFIDGKFVAYWDSILTHPQNGHCIACYEINKRFEVIGNIYEDIELLGGE